MATRSEANHGGTWPAGEAWRALLVVHARVRAAIEQAAADAGVLPMAWFDLLVTLDGTPGGRVRLGDLADVVLLTRAGLSRLVDRVEAGGLLRGEACPSDKRGAFAVLTDAGAAAVRRSWPVYRRVVDDDFGRHLPDPRSVAVGLTAVLRANGWAADQRLVQVTVPPPRRRPASSAPNPDPLPRPDRAVDTPGPHS